MLQYKEIKTKQKMTLKQDNSDVIKAPKKTGVLTEEAKGLKKTIEEADKDLAKSSFGKLLVDVKNEQSLTEAEKKKLAKKRKEAALAKKKKQEKLAKKKKEEAHKESLENAKNNLVSSATNIEISDKGEIKIDMDLSKLVKKESGKKVDLTDVFTPDVMHASIELSKVDQNGKNQVDKRKIERGMINGVPAYFYKEKGKKIALDISTYSTAKISISREDLMVDGKFLKRSDVLKKLKRDAEAKAKKAAEKELNKLPEKLAAEMPDKEKKASINDQVLFELAKGGSTNKSGGGSSGGSGGRSTGGSSGGSGGRSYSGGSGGGSYGGGRSSGGRSSGGRSSGRTYKSEKAHSHDHTSSSSSSFEVTGDYANEPFVSSKDYRGKEFKLRASAMNAFKLAEEIAKQDGYNLKIISSYRTLSRQKVLAARNTDRSIVASPGGSNHHAGGTVDVHAINQKTGRKNQKYLKTLFPKVNDELRKLNPNTPLWVNYKVENWHWEFGSGRYDKTRKNIYPKVMALNTKAVIPYETYLAKVEEEKEKQMLASGKDVVVEDYVDPRIAKYVKEDLSKKIPGRYYVGNVPGNGDRVSIVYVPPGVKDIKKFVMHFHGTHSNKLAEGYVSGGVNVPRNRLEQTVAQVASAQNTMLVYPLSAGKKRGKKGYDYDFVWMDRSKTNGEDNADLLYGKSIALAKNKFNLAVDVNKIWVQGHSAGYTPIENICKSGSFANRGEVELAFVEQDSTYGDTVKRAVVAAKKNGLNAKFYVGYVKGTKTQPGALAVKGKPNVYVIGNSRSKFKHGQYPTNFNFNTVENLV